MPKSAAIAPMAEAKISRKRWSTRCARLSSNAVGRDVTAGSGREQRVDVREGLELERIAERIEQEHRRLLARLVLEAHVRLDDEAHAAVRELSRERFPRRHVEHRAEVPYRHVLAVDQARRVNPGARVDLVRDDLVAEEHKVDPVIG